MSSIEQKDVRNRLLRALDPEAFGQLQPLLKRIDLPLRHVLVEAGVQTTNVCFIEQGLASVVATTTDNEAIEIGHIGFEGMTGAHCLLRVDSAPNRTFMQIAGEGLKLPVSNLLQLVGQDIPSRDLLLRYIHCSELQLAYSALANGRYNMSERLARWLLMCHDRIANEDMPLTHEFLALMLGVRRSGVTEQLHVLEGTKAIKATRGNIRIVDRAKLEDMAGGCYGVPEKEYDRLIGASR